MNKRNASIVGLAAIATLLAGCAAQYRNPGSCVAEMRSRLGGTSLGELSVSSRAVSYRGQRVVIEGEIKPAAAPVAASAAGAAVAAQGASAVAGSAASGQPAQRAAGAGKGGNGAGVSSAASGAGISTSAARSTVSNGAGAGATSTASGTAATAATPASAAVAIAHAAPAPAQAHPTTPIGALVAHFSHPRKTTATAAECTFDESGLKSFRWLAPAELAKTTPAHPASHSE